MRLYKDYYQGWTLALYAGAEWEFQFHGWKKFSRLNLGDIHWLTIGFFTLFEFPDGEVI